MIDVVGRLPANVLCGASASSCRRAPSRRRARRAPRSAVLPVISASVCAKKFASRIWWCVADRVVRLDRRDEVARDEPRALVDQLVERVLAVGAGLAPDHRAGRVVGDRAGPRGRRSCRSTPCRPAGSTRRSDAGTGRTAGSRASRRRRSSRTRRRASRGSPAGSRRAARSGSARPSSCAPASSSSKLSMPMTQRDRQADRAPQRVAAADPVPELEHVRGVDAERGDLLRVRRQRDEVLRDGLGRRRRACSSSQARAVRRVGQRLLRGERLARDDEQRALGIDALAASRRCACRRRSRRSARAGPASSTAAAPRSTITGRGRSRRCRC